MLCYDRTAYFNDGELLGGDGREVGEVLLDLALGADVAEQLNDRRSGRGIRPRSGVLSLRNETGRNGSPWEA